MLITASTTAAAATTTTITIISLSWVSSCLSVASSEPILQTLFLFQTLNTGIPEAYILSLHILPSDLIHSEGFVYQPLLMIPKSITLAQISLLSLKHYIHLSTRHLHCMSQQHFKPKLNTFSLPWSVSSLVSYLEEVVAIHPVAEARKLGAFLDSALSPSCVIQSMNGVHHTFYTLSFMWVGTILGLEISVPSIVLNQQLLNEWIKSEWNFWMYLLPLIPTAPSAVQATISSHQIKNSKFRNPVVEIP